MVAETDVSIVSASRLTGMSLRVLMVNRPDAQRVLGGDTVQMMRTRDELAHLGVMAEIGSGDDLERIEEYDLLHIFNWEMLGPALARLPAGKPRPPIVLSTIFWLHTGHWFQNAAKTKKIWRSASITLGEARARKIYEAWQRVKFQKSAQGKVLSRNLQSVDLLLPNSHLEIDHLEQVLGLQGKLSPRCLVVPNGVEQRFFEPPTSVSKFVEQLGRQPFVLQVARIQAAKNQAALLRALADDSFPIVFAGQPSPYEREYFTECQRLAEQRKNTYFTGQLTAEELHSLYAAAAVHVLPSWRETPGLASLEAAAAGCKIVSTSVGSASEYFGSEAWYCDPSTPSSIRAAVLTALASPASNQLRQRVKENFTWGKAARATMNGYIKMVNKNNNLTRNGGHEQ